MIELAISPLQLDPLSRDYFGHSDAYAVGQLAPLALRWDCYQIKFYKVPAQQDELIGAYQYVSYGYNITPGSIIFGFYLPALIATSNPPQFNLQITDVTLNHKFWAEPIPSIFVANYKPESLGQQSAQVTSFPALLSAPHPVVGDGLFNFEFWDTLGGTSGPGGSSQRLELVIGVLEPRSCQR